MPEMCRGEVEIAVKKNNKKDKIDIYNDLKGKGLIVRVHGIISSCSK